MHPSATASPNVELGVAERRLHRGLMVSEGRSFILDQWWIATFPGIAIFVVVLAFNLVGDTLRDILDPRQYK